MIYILNVWLKARQKRLLNPIGKSTGKICFILTGIYSASWYTSTIINVMVDEFFFGLLPKSSTTYEYAWIHHRRERPWQPVSTEFQQTLDEDILLTRSKPQIWVLLPCLCDWPWSYWTVTLTSGDLQGRVRVTRGGSSGGAQVGSSTPTAADHL
jgi:hypothetical protein